MLLKKESYKNEYQSNKIVCFAQMKISFLQIKFCLIIIMGNINDPKSFLQKGQGLRILSIKLNSPFDNKVEPFFDFIIDIIQLQPKPSAKEILDKLADGPQAGKNKRVRSFNEIIEANEDRKLEIKIVSTKHRNVRSIMITPHRNWNGKKDLIGITTRKQRYDQAFDTFFPVGDIKINSPIQLAGVKHGEYLLGCMEFQYNSLDKFIEGLYDRFFDKEVIDKRVNLALYDMVEDEVNIKPVLLRRDWGGKGLLGCDFLQGHVFKFPSKIKQKRNELLQQKKSVEQRIKIKEQLTQCDGVSKALSDALINKRHKKGKHARNIRNMIPEFPLPQVFRPQQPEQNPNLFNEQQQHDNSQNINPLIIQQQNVRIEFLERRVLNLEQTLRSVKGYLSKISQQDEQVPAVQQQKMQKSSSQQQQSK